MAVERCWSAGGAYPDVNMICQCATAGGVCSFSAQFVTPAHDLAAAKALMDAFEARIVAMAALEG